MLKENVSYKVKGYSNKWSVIDNCSGFALLENETYGDETCYLVVREDVEIVNKTYTRGSERVTLPTIIGETYETYDDLQTALDDIL